MDFLTLHSHVHPAMLTLEGVYLESAGLLLIIES